MKIFLFFSEAIKIAGLAQKKTKVGRVSGNTDIFFFYAILFSEVNITVRINEESS